MVPVARPPCASLCPPFPLRCPPRRSASLAPSLAPPRLALRCLALPDDPPTLPASPPPSDSRLWASFMQAHSSPHPHPDPPPPPPPSSPPRALPPRLPHLQKFFFHAQPHSKVQVAVSKAGEGSFVVEILVDTGDMFLKFDEPLKLHWGLFRSDSTEWVLLEPDEAPGGTVIMDGV